MRRPESACVGARRHRRPRRRRLWLPFQRPVVGRPGPCPPRRWARGGTVRRRHADTRLRLRRGGWTSRSQPRASRGIRQGADSSARPRSAGHRGSWALSTGGCRPRRRAGAARGGPAPARRSAHVGRVDRGRSSRSSTVVEGGQPVAPELLPEAHLVGGGQLGVADGEGHAAVGFGGHGDLGDTDGQSDPQGLRRRT